MTLHDFMVGPANAQADGPGDEPHRPRLVRLVSGVSGRVPMVLAYRPLAGFAEDFAVPEIAGGRVTAPGCPGLVAEVGLVRDGAGAAARFTLEGGQARSFSLYAGALPETPPDARALMERTRSAWVLWTREAAYTGPLADELIRSALVLKALTYAPTGAIVAAATTSLPEAVGGIRNWDYRFCWIRDACLSLYVLKKFRMPREAEAFFGFVADLCAREGPAAAALQRLG